MIGYRNDRSRQFGWAAARLDDLLNYLPARLTGLLLVTAAFPLGLNGWAAWRIMLRDAGKHASPNAGWPEAACAGALGVQLGGPADYFGERIEKATLGDADQKLSVDHYRRMIRLLYGSSFLAAALGILLLGLTR
jgi:adenosylcobinamide-phosphate synthase